mmetsp:Transcript_31436/g.94443  ORF Transcript_31436/g.94443 Transcript_31436/m.94443 type:complete len:1023 (+) Transcript_31436:5048-8116(+)
MTTLLHERHKCHTCSPLSENTTTGECALGRSWNAPPGHHGAVPPPPPPPPPTISPVQATVPGDIITDLQRAGVIRDPYFNTTWRDPAFVNVWNSGVWEYSTSFLTPVAGNTDRVLVVFDGIRMGAMIHLNGVFLGNATDQFMRYTFPVELDRRPSTSRAWLYSQGSDKQNTLTVSFGASLGISTRGRFTHSTEIDWAPTMTTKECWGSVSNECLSTFGFGIWKSVYLLPVLDSGAAILHLIPHTFYSGGHPTSLLTDESHEGFEIRVSVDLVVTGSSPVSGRVSVLGTWPGAAAVSQTAKLVPGVNTVTVVIPATQSVGARLWQPHGHGDQALYNITATYTPNHGAPSATTRRLGFRHVALVTINDTDATTRAAANHTSGTGQFTMFFRVNGAAVYARGGNKVPMDLLDGRVTADSTRRLVQSAVEGNMNMLRIWGGGIWEPRAFFDAADEFGLLLYTDMQFTWGFIDGSQQDKSEIEYQVKRNSHHPSIAMWDGCNECGGGGLYESFVMPTVAAVDQSRPVWPSCPAPGWTNGVHTLNSLPDNTTLRLGSGGSPRPVPFPFAQEAHGPYTAFMKDSVEGIVMPKAQAQQAVGGTNDPTATPAWTGPGEEGWYRSEFGCVAWSSFESMTAQLPSDQWGMQTPAGVNRNWSPANIINVFFGGRAAAAMSETGEVAFKRQLYQSMVGQALFLKTEIEGWRSQNVFGTTIWMYNEMWPTGGWGSIEYGSTVPGQVSGGRWKPLHYQFRKSTFADQMSTCNTGGACFVTNDAPFPFSGVVSVRLVNVLSGASGIMAQESVSLKPGAGITKWFCATATRNDSVRGVYADHPRQIPTNRDNFTKNIQGTQEQCEAACNADPSCLGFTGAQPVKECWLYSEVATLMNFADADWFQKPGTKPIPAPPTPPPPPPPTACAEGDECAYFQCSSSFQCVASSAGHFTSEAGCLSMCAPFSSRYSCYNGRCIRDSRGLYNTSTDCSTACFSSSDVRKTESGWSCVGGVCTEDSNGAFTSEAACEAGCTAVAEQI